MYTAHALLEPHGIPWDVVVDHEPAELEVDTFARSFGGHHHLGRFAELTLRIDAGVRGIPVTNLHAAVNLSDVEAPFFP